MQPGEIVGHYRIVEPLGKGGMGEVFVAEDTRLHRRVALKVLPTLFAADPDYRQRFEREAQAVAALNHPNIVTIHSVEEHDGRLFLTMELVDGRPLGELIPNGGLALDRLLRIGIEVADALAAAQARGITHRDVKPGNVIVTPQGRAKVLDFGLAKLHEAEAARASDDLTRMSSSSTITGEGKIVGTVAYMSPEQAEGKPVDPRSDIFSLGVVIHEMATGQKPFRGDTNVSVISAIIKDTPAPITDSNPNLPADLARIVRRCLAKDPERRYQTALDLRNELEELKQDTASGVITTVRPARTGGNRRAAIAAIAGVILVAAGAGWYVFGRDRSAATVDAATFTLDRLARLTSTGTASMAAMSPDGRYVVHVKGEPGGLGLWTRQTATTSDVRIVAPSDSRFDGLAFAPDGNYVYYTVYPPVGGVAALYRVPVLGGTPHKLVDDIDSPVTFSPDQKRIAFMRGSMVRGTTELMVADADGGNARVLATSNAPDKFQPEGPSWSPDGTTILATASSMRPGLQIVVYAVDVQSGAARPTGEGWAFARDVQWLPGGGSYLVTGIDFSGLATPQIWRVAYPSGERTRVTNDLNSYVGASVSADGRSLATVQTETVAAVYVAAGPDKEPQRVSGGAGRADGSIGLAWLPDGRLVYSSNASGLPQLWIADTDGGNARQLTTTLGPSTQPWTAADGKWIYFTSYAKEGNCLFRIAPDGAGLQQLTTDGNSRNPVVSPDGQTLYYSAMRDGLPRLMQMPAEGGPAAPAVDQQFRAHHISFDGTRMLGSTWSETHRRSVAAMVKLAEKTIELLPETPGTTLFMPDGGMAIVQRIQGRSVVSVRSAGDKRFRPVTPPHDDFILATAVARDGRIAFSRGNSTSDVVLIKAK
jgi:Tol biopolymer transport system component/predicted Ser/Thr protein kinase